MAKKFAISVEVWYFFDFFQIFECKNLKLLKATGNNSKYEKISSLLISFLSHTHIIFLFNCCQSFKNHKKPKLSKKFTQNNHIPKETHKGQFSKGNPPLKCIIFNLKLQYFTVLPEMNKEIH